MFWVLILRVYKKHMPFCMAVLTQSSYQQDCPAIAMDISCLYASERHCLPGGHARENSVAPIFSRAFAGMPGKLRLPGSFPGIRAARRACPEYIARRAHRASPGTFSPLFPSFIFTPACPPGTFSPFSPSHFHPGMPGARTENQCPPGMPGFSSLRAAPGTPGTFPPLFPSVVFTRACPAGMPGKWGK